MELVKTPEYISRDAFEVLRAPRPVEARFDGLYVSGDLASLALPTVAIVGTRAATPYGKRVARAFAHGFARAGCCVISGLAVGIDKAAHEGALEATGPTLGVLGSGHERFYPARNLALAERMIEAGGAVLSPFAPGQGAHPAQFLHRNGVIAALADAVVVIEAPIDRPHVQGCLSLIRDGAILARNAGDVLEVLRLLPLPLARSENDGETKPDITLIEADTDIARAILTRLAQGECDVNILVNDLHIAASEIMAILTMLECEDKIESRGGGLYALPLSSR
jgi:DNA processing protein